MTRLQIICFMSPGNNSHSQKNAYKNHLFFTFFPHARLCISTFTNCPARELSLALCPVQCAAMKRGEFLMRRGRCHHTACYSAGISVEPSQSLCNNGPPEWINASESVRSLLHITLRAFFYFLPRPARPAWTSIRTLYCSDWMKRGNEPFSIRL